MIDIRTLKDDERELVDRCARDLFGAMMMHAADKDATDRLADSAYDAAERLLMARRRWRDRMLMATDASVMRFSPNT